MHRRMLAGVVFVLGSVVWTIAKELTDNQLGAIPTVIIVGPFIYWAARLWRSGDRPEVELKAERHAYLEKRLELATANSKLSAEKRAEAKRLLEDLRSEAITQGLPLEGGRTSDAPPSKVLDETADKNAEGMRLSLLSVSLIVVTLVAAGVWYGRSQRSGSVAERASPARTASASSQISAGAGTTDNPSAFAKRSFAGISISTPKDWRPIGENDARSINTNSEALADAGGMPVGQGNNTILWAANADDDTNVTRATMRLSVRVGQTAGQPEMRDALTQPQKAIEHELFTVAEKAAAVLRKLPQTQYYNVIGAGLRQNGSTVCTWTSWEYDMGKGPTVSDLWICPASDRTFKLATSYAKARAALYAATIDHTWRSLSLEPTS